MVKLIIMITHWTTNVVAIFLFYTFNLAMLLTNNNDHLSIRWIAINCKLNTFVTTDHLPIPHLQRTKIQHPAPPSTPPNTHIETTTSAKFEGGEILITCKIFRAFLISPLLSRTRAAKPVSGTSSLVQWQKLLKGK